MSGRPAIRAFFDEATNTFSYLVADPATRRAAVIDPVLDYDPKSGEVDIRSVEAILAAAAEGRPDDRMVARDPRPRRPLVRLALREGEDRRQDRHRREHQGGAAHFPAGVQRHRPEDGRQRLRSPVQGRRAVRDRAARGRGHPHPRAHARVHQLQDRGCGVRRRYLVHAGLRHRARRLPRRRRAQALSVDPQAHEHCRRRRACSCVTITRPPVATAMHSRPRSASSAAGTCTSTRASGRTSSSPCATRAMPRCPRPRCCCRRSR